MMKTSQLTLRSRGGGSPKLEMLSTDRKTRLIQLGWPYCCLCGKRAEGKYYHYLQQTEKGRRFLATHPVTPMICEKCAQHHDRKICRVWNDAKCVVSDEILETNTTIY
jgi:hypothetical protein